MNCANHADVSAVAYCRTCGKPLCGSCERDVRGVVYCEECLASHLGGTVPPPVSAAVPPGEKRPGVGSPALAALLGFIPGVGAIYNGEYGKGFLHVVIFGTLIWMTAHLNGLFGLGIAAFVIYMPVEAYQTARARELGLPPPDPLGLNNVFSSAPAGAPPPVTAGVVPAGEGAQAPPVALPPEAEARRHIPIGALILIALGVLFLLDEMNLLHFDWIWRFWPLILIAIGIRVLMTRQRRGW